MDGRPGSVFKLKALSDVSDRGAATAAGLTSFLGRSGQFSGDGRVSHNSSSISMPNTKTGESLPYAFLAAREALSAVGDDLVTAIFGWILTERVKGFLTPFVKRDGFRISLILDVLS